MVTSNLDFSEWGDVFPANRMLGVATRDRLRHGAYRLILEGEVIAPPDPYRRPQKRQLRNTRKSPNLDSVRDPDFGTLKWRHYAAFGGAILPAGDSTVANVG